jgi:hypothetical protein
MNVIEFPLDRVRNPERDTVGNEPDAKNPANEASETPRYTVASEHTDAAQRLAGVRATEREEAERLLRRNSTPFGKEPTPEDAADERKPSKAPRGKAAENSITAAPVLAKTGYEIPKSVSAQYVAFEGKFLDRKSETVHFEDKGRVLSTESNDRNVISHMVELAKAKSWGELNLKGTEEFRREAWIAAELAGLQSRGFKPTAQDHATLQAARETMRIGSGDKSANTEPKKENVIELAAGVGRDKDAPKVDAAKDAPKPGAQQKIAEVVAQVGKEAAVVAAAGVEAAVVGPVGPVAASAPVAEVALKKAAEAPQERPGVTTGVLLEHGPARFEHDPKKNPSYFVRVGTTAGERTVWGLDLERAMKDSGIEPGQRIELEKTGSKPVQAVERKFDEQGREIEAKTIETSRNAWHATSPDAPARDQGEPAAQASLPTEVAAQIAERRRIAQVREAFLRGELPLKPEQQVIVDAARERIKETAARSVMEDAIKGLSPQAQETVRGEFESVVADARANNRPLDVPMPQVSEQTIEKVRAEIVREQGAPERNQEERAVAEHVVSEHDAPSLELDY